MIDVDRRDELHLRMLRGDVLTDEERAYLNKLDAELDAVLPRPEPLPDDVRELMREFAKRSLPE